MKTFVGVGKGNVKDAVNQATRGLSAPQMLLFAAPYEMLEQTAKLLWEMYPQVPHIGTIGISFANGEIGEKNVVVSAFFQDTKTKCGIIEHISKYPILAVHEIQKNAQSVNPGNQDTVCIEYCTGAEENLVTIFHACIEKKGIGLIGGTTGDLPKGETGMVAYNGAVYKDACVYAFIKNMTGKAKVYKENIYKKKNELSHFATKVDISRKALIELDGKPAAQVYSQELGIPKDKIIANVLKNPMGRVVGDQVFISSMKEFGSGGELINYKRINQNDCIYFLELDDYEERERKTREKIRSDMKTISLVVSIDCGHRYLLYTNEHYIEQYAKDMASLGAHIGVVGGGEQYKNQHVNQTMVCAVFE